MGWAIGVWRRGDVVIGVLPKRQAGLMLARYPVAVIENRKRDWERTREREGQGHGGEM